MLQRTVSIRRLKLALIVVLVGALLWGIPLLPKYWAEYQQHRVAAQAPANIKHQLVLAAPKAISAGKPMVMFFREGSGGLDSFFIAHAR